MAKPTSAEVASFGPSTVPFGRNPLKNYADHYKEAHWVKVDFEDKIHDACEDGLPVYPEQVEYLPTTDIEGLRILLAAQETKKRYCYLWILDFDGIKILYEDTPNFLDEESKMVKHTNITGGQEAFHGGELFVSADHKLFVNNKSDRYGRAELGYWQAAIAYFEKTYNKYSIIDLSSLI